MIGVVGHLSEGELLRLNVFRSRLAFSSLALQDFEFTVNVSVANATKGLMEKIVLNANLTDIALNTTSILLVNRNFHLEGGQYVDPGCLQRAILNASLASVDSSTRLRNLTFAANDVTLDGQLAALFNNIFLVFDTQFPAFLPTLVARLGRIPVAEKLNAALADLTGSGNSSACGLYNSRADGLYSAFPLPEMATIISFAVAGVASFLVLVLTLYFNYAKVTSSRRSSPSLFMSPDVPLWMRFSIPIALIFSIATFVICIAGTTGFTSVIVTVDGNTQIIPPSVFLFNLPNLVKDSYESGAWANVIGLAGLGIAWIVLRQVLMLLAFFIPVRTKQHRNWRRKSIHVLDYLGKWAGFFMIEALLIPMAFRLHIEPVDGFVIDLYTAGCAAFFLYIVGLVVSLLAGHFVASAERQDEASQALEFAQDDGPRVALFRRSFRWNKRLLQLRTSVVIVTALALVLTLALTCGSIFTNSFSFTLEGMAGKLLPLVNTTQTRSYSILSTQMNYNELTLPGRWVTFSEVIVWITCIVMPVVCSLAFFVLFFVPFSKAGLRRCLVVVEVCRTWNLLEVHCFAILAAILSISLIGQYMLGDKCMEINKLLAEYFANLLSGDPKCFDVKVRECENGTLLIDCCASLTV